MNADTPLHTINLEAPAFKHLPSPGALVAFREDHPVHGNTELTALDQSSQVGAESPYEGQLRPEPTAEKHAMYGKVIAVGLLEDGNLAIDVLVFDPADGAPGAVADGEPEPEYTVYRATMGEIQ